MHRTMMKSKIHRATVTGADLNYVGSITLCPRLMESADLLEHDLADDLLDQAAIDRLSVNHGGNTHARVPAAKNRSARQSGA